MKLNILLIILLSTISFPTMSLDNYTGSQFCVDNCTEAYEKCVRHSSSFFCSDDLNRCLKWKCGFEAGRAQAKVDEMKSKNKPLNELSGVFTIQQKSTMRYLDAHEIRNKDFRIVTRPRQNNRTQQWRIKPLGNNTFTIRQVSNGRYVDAHEYAGKDFGLVTRPNQRNNTQQWIIKKVGNYLYTIQQKSNGRFIDAHVTNNRDYEVVTRSLQNNNTQKWLIKRVRKNVKK